MAGEETGASRRGPWRLASAAPLPLLLVVYALWTDLVTLDGAGFHLVGGLPDVIEWLALTLGTVVLVAALWAPARAIRILGGAVYSLALAFGFGAAGVVALVHGLGGPRGDLAAPGWALVTLVLTSLMCGLALLALAALLVEEIRAADTLPPRTG
jgi:hypothetical protein